MERKDTIKVEIGKEAGGRATLTIEGHVQAYVDEIQEFIFFFTNWLRDLEDGIEPNNQQPLPPKIPRIPPRGMSSDLRRKLDKWMLDD